MGKTVYSPQYRINLLSLFGEAFGENPAKEKIRPLLSNENFKAAFGKKVISKIQERSLSGIDKNGNPFPGYSEAYMKSLVFKIYQKSAQVNMKLTGEMLASMKVAEGDQRTFVLIEFIDDHNKNKAHGHITGRLGKSVVRDFFGLPREEEIKLLKETVKAYQSDNLINLLDYSTLDGLGLDVAVGGSSKKLAVGQNNFLDITTDDTEFFQ